MKKVLSIALLFIGLCALVAALSSCQSVKKLVHKTSRDSTATATSQVHTNTAVTTITHTVTDCDTNVTLRADTTQGSKPLQQITEGHPLVVDDGNTAIDVSYNARTGNIDAKAVSKPKTIPLRIHTTTDQAQQLNTATAEKAQQKTEVKASASDKSVQKAGASFWVWVGIVGGILLLVIVIYLIYCVVHVYKNGVI